LISLIIMPSAASIGPAIIEDKVASCLRLGLLGLFWSTAEVYDWTCAEDVVGKIGAGHGHEGGNYCGTHARVGGPLADR